MHNYSFSKFLSSVAIVASVVGGLLFSTVADAQNYNPKNYWTFDGSNALADNMSQNALDPSYYQSTYNIGNASSGSVGKSLVLNSNSRIVVATTPFVSDSGFTLEFLFKPSMNINNTIQFFSKRDGAINLRFGYATFRFSTKGVATGTSSPVSDNFDIDLKGIGRASYGWYVDGNWHHLVFKYDAKAGTKELWVDGQLPAGFSKTVPAGKMYSSSTTNDNICDINTNTQYYKVFGNMDEIALYAYPLKSAMIYKHYLDFVAGNHYTFSNTTITVPAASSVVGLVDPAEYAPGHPNANVDAWTQIKTFPVPRYKPGHTLFPNVPIYNPSFLTGYTPGSQVTNTQIQLSKQIQLEFASNYNYTIQLANNTHNYYNYSDTNSFDGAWIKLANQNPQFKTSANSYWPQLTPSSAGYTATDNYVQCGCMTNNSYLRNAAGQFLDEYGNVITYKRLSPEAPVDSLKLDGKTQRFYLNALTQKLTRNLDVVFENGEIIPWYNTNGLAKDPTVNAAKTAMGVDWSTYIGRNFNRFTQAYKNEFMTLPALSNTKFSYYQISGHPVYNWKYSEVRTVNTLVNGHPQSTGDFYPVYPWNWKTWSGAWKGWQFLVDSRYQELQFGDNLFAPTVSPGWNSDEEKIVRPGQWLGLLKAVAMTGAEYFNTAYFVLTSPYQDPKNYVWQMVMPAYVQAVSSRYEDLLRNGTLMNGDYPNDPISNTTQPGYSFYAGDPRKLVVARKHNTLPKYAITGTIQPNSNMVGNAENEGVAVINLDGQTLKFKIRRQGSTYIYDKSNASSPVFYQLDGWHEASHPYNWSKSFEIEAELFDNTNSNLDLVTKVPSGTQAGDYTNYTTAVSFKAATTAEYNFYPRGTTAVTHYIWVLARSKNGVAADFNIAVDGGTAASIKCVTDTSWKWYRINNSTGLPVSYTNLSLQNHKLSITSTNSNLEIDRITVTPVSGAIYTLNVAVPCNVTSTTASITAASTTSFCQGGSVVLTANAGTSYLWTNGATTRSITVTAAGTYNVTVTTSGTPATATPVTVTVNPLPLSTVTTSGSLVLCSGSSVTLTASTSGAVYHWSNGATTRVITVSAAGSYNVTVTSASGCSSVSTPSVVTLSSGNAGTATITAGGLTTFCQGKNVVLTANSGTSYLWSNGATTRSITVATSGSYAVTVSNLNSCPATSAAKVVTVNPLPSPTFSASGPLSFCHGGSVTLSSSAQTGYTYMWFKDNSAITGALSNAYTANAVGGYKVRVSLNGCSQYSPSYNVTIPCREGDEPGAAVMLDAMVYPNPADGMTTIAFNTEDQDEMKVELLDSQGRLVDIILNQTVMNQGRQEINYQTTHLPKGIYMVRISSQSGTRLVRLVCI